MSKNLEKLKQFFRSNRATGGQDRVQVLTAEIERELKKDTAIERRLKLIKELGEVGAAAKLEEVNKLKSYFSNHFKMIFTNCTKFIFIFNGSFEIQNIFS